MLTLTTTASPGGRRVAIALEELGLPYALRVVEMSAIEQIDPEFLKKSPNQTLPLLEDDGIVLFESGAMLLYLAEREGALIPKGPNDRARMLQYVFLSSRALGPNLDRLLAQLRKPIEERSRDLVEAVGEEVSRGLEALERILEDGRPYLADEYTVADIMHYPWLQPLHAMRAPPLLECPNVVAWLARVAERPAVTRGMSLQGR